MMLFLVTIRLCLPACVSIRCGILFVRSVDVNFVFFKISVRVDKTNLYIIVAQEHLRWDTLPYTTMIQQASNKGILVWEAQVPQTAKQRLPSKNIHYSLKLDSIGLVNNIHTIEFFTGVSRNTQSKSYRWLSVSRNSQIMHHLILINMSY